MKVLIIEDEKLAADHLSGLIQKYDAGIAILDMLTTVKQGIRWFESNPAPDLAFFDIQLADGISFEIFENTNVACPVIFTTAFNEYALKAFKVNSVDYLLKPIDFEELHVAIDKFKNTRNFQNDDKYREVVNNVF
jgi:two-component SAPR family response regulator